MGDRHHMSRRGPNTSLYVRPIDASTRPDEIKLLFQEYGNVRDVHIPIDFNTRQPRGFAYIEFETIEDAEYAQKKLNRTRLNDKMLHVDFAQGDRKTPGQMKTQKEATALRLQIEEIKRMQQEQMRKAREDEMRREGIPISKSDRDAYSDRRYTKRDDRDRDRDRRDRDRGRDRRSRDRDRRRSRDRDDRRGDRDRDGRRGDRDRGDRDDRRGGREEERSRDRSRDRGGSRRDRDDRRGRGGSRDERDFGRGDRGGFRDRSRSPRRDRGDRDMRVKDERHIDGYSGQYNQGGRNDDRGYGGHGGHHDDRGFGHDDRGESRPNYDP
ncbi:Oidioi.mRNA.OKI2018_I69.PAR.g13216.t2.cds [Oikopleura dioica]|uniref:Oidioi.mRNA.OKI2018_I69.PAR.g13216.t2.cds n=1 Tax=Oikopleura dioica TaxID=34765 RepID=A0ABN7S6Y7_OIKDI|nr:Oidioi.mRNA.OKI2018_I69.PAR.g13216.t2.cds [Oikopleura dioica]